MMRRKSYEVAGFWASPLPGLGEWTLRECKSNIARSNSFSVRPLPVRSNRALQEEQRAFKNTSSGSDSTINFGSSSTFPVFHTGGRHA